MRYALIAVLITLIVGAVALRAQNTPAPNPQRGGAQGQIGGRGGGAAQPTTPALPTPRWPDGHVNLGTAPGEKGLWQGDGRLANNPNSYEPNNAGVRAALVHIKDVPLQPWARALTDYRHANVLRTGPHPRCKPSGGPRQFVTPYGVEIVDMPEMKRVFIMDIGGPHSFRVVYMDGRPHPKDLELSYYGHSIGRWDGDTLVIDTVGFNEKFWMNRDGLPHTDRMHLIERLTRPDSRTLKYEVTIDDTGAYTATWTSGFTMRWTEGLELFEYVCQDNNQLPVAITDDEGHNVATSKIVP